MARTNRWSWAVIVAVCLTLLASLQHKSLAPAAASAQSEDPALRAAVDLYLLEQLFALDDHSYSNAQVSRVVISPGGASLCVAFDRTSRRTMILERGSPTPRAQTERITRNLSFVYEAGEWKLVRDVPAVEDLAGARTRSKTSGPFITTGAITHWP